MIGPDGTYTIDPARHINPWSIGTEAHQVNGLLYSNASGQAGSSGRRVILTQSSCASSSARLQLGYLQGSVRVQLAYNSSMTGTEAEEFHFMLVAGGQLLDSHRAVFPVKQVAWADLYAEGLRGTLNVDLLLRFWPRNANMHGCPGRAPHLLAEPPFPTTSCGGPMLQSRCAMVTSGTNSIEVRLQEDSIRGWSVLPQGFVNVSLTRAWDDGTQFEFGQVPCLVPDGCAAGATAFGGACDRVEAVPGGKVECTIARDGKLQLGSDSVSSVQVRRGTGPHVLLQTDKNMKGNGTV